MKTSPAPFSPYIGITDFMTHKQSATMLSTFQAMTEETVPHKLMVGVMMSYKTLNHLETKWSTVFPKAEEVKDIFIAHPLAFNTLHYADYTNTDVPTSLAKAIFYGGKNLNALQLDMVWPSPQDIEEAFNLLADVGRVPVILQVGTKAMEQAGDKVAHVISRLVDYADIIDGVLFDKSMGQGKPMNPEVLMPYVEAVYKYIPGMRVSVAGGLGPTTTQIVEPLISKFPDISIDAQGRLRPSGSALDPIDWSMAEEYLQKAVGLFKKYN